MTELPGGDPAAACLSLAARARSGAQEIESLLSSRVDAPELQQLRSLASKLQQLGANAQTLAAKLGEERIASPELQRMLSAEVSECNDTAGTIVKQLMRIGPNTPREAISVATVTLYETFVDATTRVLAFVTQVLAMDSVDGQNAQIHSQDAGLVLSAAASARHDVSRSSGTLLDTEEAKMSGEPSDAKPPGYAVYEDAPPAFEEAHIFAHAKYASPEHDATGGSSNSSSGENKGLLNSLASPFKAATAALRTKPEPFVTALCQASAAGNVSQIRSLLAQGANINGRNDEGQTALICAVRAGRMDSVRILLESGADTSRADAGSKGRPPLYHAVDLANRSAAELLLKHSADANQKDSWGQRYFLALVAGDTAPEWIELLLSYGADALAKDISGQAAAVLALKRRKRKEDREEVVRLLLRHGAGTNTRDTDGTPLVHLCVQQERRGLALELLNLGADPSAKDASGISLLEVAVKNGDLELARAIVEKGADPNAKDFNGSHLLFTALGSNKSPGAGNMALAVMLLEHGARGGVKDFYGVTALEHALSPIIQGISAGSLPPPGGDKLNVPELLLKQGADPNQRLTKVSCEPTVLAYAVDRGLSDLAELVLRYRAAVNTVDKDGRTPLVRAVQRGDVDIVGMLLQHGANVNQPGPGLPLDVAVAMGNAEVADLLRSHGAEK